MKTDWDEHFKNAHLHSWPHAGCVIQKKKTSNRSIYREDEKMILAAAKKYVYEILDDNTDNVSFIKRNKV